MIQRFKDVIGKLSYPIDLNQRDWFIKELLPLTSMPLTKQKIDTLQDYVEKATWIESMVGYPHEYWGKNTS